MATHWIPADTTISLLGKNGIDFVSARMALCARAFEGLVNTKAKRLSIGKEQRDDVEVPKKFWWATGHEALDQDWSTGDFATWVDRSVHWRAFGVQFALSDVLELLPFEKRAVISRSMSVAGNPDWITAKEARRFAYEQAGMNPNTAGRAIIEQARLGFIAGRAVVAYSSLSTRGADDWEWEEREWDVPTWFWEHLTLQESSHQDWELGKFSGRGVTPQGRRAMTLMDVRFLRDSMAALLPMSPKSATDVRDRKAGGRPPAPFHDDLMCAVWGLIYQGDLEPKRQAEVERAIQTWAIAQGHEIGETATREKARKIWATMSSEVKNPNS